MAIQSEHFTGGRVVVIALIGQSEILLINESTKPLPHYWKLISETVKPEESLLNAVIGGIREEAGFKDIQVEYGTDGKIRRVTDPRIKNVVQFGDREWIRSRFPHWRYFFGVLTTDVVIRELSGQHLEVDDTEHINTQAFPLAVLHTVADLLRQHAELIRSIPHRMTTQVGV